MIAELYLFPNGMFVGFDKDGELVSEITRNLLCDYLRELRDKKLISDETEIHTPYRSTPMITDQLTKVKDWIGRS